MVAWTGSGRFVTWSGNWGRQNTVRGVGITVRFSSYPVFLTVRVTGCVSIAAVCVFILADGDVSRYLSLLPSPPCVFPCQHP